MPCIRKLKPAATPAPCLLLAQARAQMALLTTGGQVTVVETPQLGRVEYSAPGGGLSMSVGELQRYIDQLAAQCAAAGGDPGPGGGMRRRPLSLEAWP